MGYYGPKGFYELKGSVAPAYVAPPAMDEAVARMLWEVSEKLTGVEWPAEEKSRASVVKRQAALMQKPFETDPVPRKK